ncbi:MAG: DUF6371 domain-containing protein [Bacteroidota bacterium]
MQKIHYKLDPSPKKYICPSCLKKRFVRYLNTESGEYLPEHFGRCDRESNCGYHLNPYKTGYKTNDGPFPDQRPQFKPQPIHFIPTDILNATLRNYSQNTFISNLLKLASASDIEKIILLYRIGTIGKGCRAGAATFPFIDKSGNIRTIQAKQFDNTNHTTSTDFVHSILIRHYADREKALPEWLSNYSKNEKRVSCLFGEHLLSKYSKNTVALVEAPKTAIIATLYYGLPDNSTNLLWLAVYNKSSLNAEKCKALQGRNVVLFPDLNAFSEWSSKAEELNNCFTNTKFLVSDLLESKANGSDKHKGLDLADYLTRFDLKLFNKKKPMQTHDIAISPKPVKMNESDSVDTFENYSENPKKSSLLQPNNKNTFPFDTELVTWSAEIDLLESYFSSIQLPDTPIRLNQCTVILNLPGFISDHLVTLRKYNGNTVFIHFLNRLQLLKQILESSTLKEFKN